MIASKTYISRSIERLHGILYGISIDNCITDKEIIALKYWLEEHKPLHDVEPFFGLVDLLDDILEDNVIDDDEREMLLGWCKENMKDHGFLEGFTPVIHHLHGILSGIISDDELNTDEITGLKTWLMSFEELKNWWPFNDLIKIVERVLADGSINETEKNDLKAFFLDFQEQVIESPTIHDAEYWENRHMINLSPIFKSVSNICDKKVRIVFPKKTFCFTGPAASGSRKKLFNLVTESGGIPCKNPIIDLDYLVIGAQSSPAWVYSTYGRKIELVMNRKRHGLNCPTKIVTELNFIEALTL
jgi:hypothetical protein